MSSMSHNNKNKTFVQAQSLKHHCVGNNLGFRGIFLKFSSYPLLSPTFVIILVCNEILYGNWYYGYLSYCCHLSSTNLPLYIQDHLLNRKTGGRNSLLKLSPDSLLLSTMFLRFNLHQNLLKNNDAWDQSKKSDLVNSLLVFMSKKFSRSVCLKHK